MATSPFFVVNPNAANGRLGRQWPEIEAKVRERFPDLEYARTTRQGEATELAREAVGRGFHYIVSCGGDGTHNEVVNGLFEDDEVLHPDVTLGVLPFGTGGDLRRTIGAMGGLDDHLERLATGTNWRVDVGRLDFVDHDGAAATRYFLNIASCGVSGLTDILVNKTTKRFGGRVSFLVGTLRALATYDNPEITVEMDDLPAISAPMTTAVVANGQYFGGGMHIAPKAEMDDGWFDVVLGYKANLIRSARSIAPLYRGTHLRFPWFTHHRAKVVTMRGEGVYLDVDGEAPGTLPATYRMLEGALELKVKRP